MKARNDMSYRIVLQCIIALGVLMPCAVRADEQQHHERLPQGCFKGEYILEGSPVRALREKTVEEFSQIVPGKIAVRHETAGAVLVETRDGDGVESEGVIEPLAQGERLCSNLRRHQRAQRRIQRIVRRATCDCNGVVEASVVPNDSLYSQQWALNQSSDIDMDAPEAWNLSTGSASVIVAVIDTGVELQHPDLKDNIWRNTAEIAGDGIDNDGNGYIDDTNGWNFYANTNNPNDDNGHGTHVSGIIAGKGNNGAGIAGVGWNTRILPVKFLGSNGSGSFYSAIQAIDYVTMMKTRGVNIVLSNNSWGGQGTYSSIRDAIMRARNAGVLFVAAAGNSAANTDSTPFTPASEGVDNMIAVASLDSYGNLSSFSNYGATTVNIGAPGSVITSTYLNAQYANLSGTSMAAPQVSGVLALVAADRSSLAWNDLRRAVLESGVAMPSLSGKCTTGRFLNAYNALVRGRELAQSQPTPSPTATATATATPTRTPTPTATPTPVPGRWILSGYVRSGTDGVARVKVNLTAGGQTYVKWTDSSGRFAFEPIWGPIAYTIDPVEEGGYTFTTRSGTLSGDTSVDVAATRVTYPIEVHILDTQGRARSGISVDGSDGAGSGTTGSDGKVTLNGAQYGKGYTIRITTAGTGNPTRIIPFLHGKMVINFTVD